LPDLTGNLTEVTITEADLLARAPTLNSYLPQGQADWSGQLAVGVVDAQEAFQSMTGKKPVRAKARVDDHWKRILVAYTLLAIYREFEPAEAWMQRVERWEDRSEKWLSRFLWDYDADESGAISETVDEGPRRAREIIIQRG
jgi:hypothetical protein